jgi:hypothetical protein
MVKIPIFLFKIDMIDKFYVLKYRLILLKYDFLISILSFFIALKFAYWCKILSIKTLNYSKKCPLLVFLLPFKHSLIGLAYSKHS